MKKLFVFIIILLLTLSFAASVYADSETDIFNELKSMGFENAYVAIENGSLLMRFEAPAISENFSDILLSVAVKGYEKYTDANTVVVESYLNDSPALGVVMRGEDIAQWRKGAISDSDLYKRADFIDLRSDEANIKDDLAGFNAYTDEVRLDDNNAKLIVHYFGKDTDFMDDFAAMAFFVVQDAPYADNISITYAPHAEGKYLTVQTTRSNVLSLYNGDLSQNDFAKSVITSQSANSPKISVGGSGIIGIINGVLGKISLKNGFNFSNSIIELIAAGVLFLLFLIFMSMARRRKKRIAYITKTKKISLENFPGKNRVYGKLVGIVQASNPLEAPFSKKSAVIYSAELSELRKNRGDEDGSSKWVPIWKDKKAADFIIKEADSEKGILVKGRGTLPQVDLPVTFNREVKDKNDPVIQPFLRNGVFSFMSHQRFRAKERALENGRKVFFIGGIQRVEKGFEFIRRPHFVNMLSMHSESTLTGHYKKVSFWLTLFAIIFLLCAAYLLLVYFGVV